MGGIKDREIEMIREGLAADTSPVTINGKRIRLTKEALQRMAKQSRGKPLLHEHKGRPIGRVIDAHVDGEGLILKVGIFKPQNERERRIVDKIKSGELRGLSPGFSYSEEDVESHQH